MSFKLTYATMFDPPEELHERFEAAMARVSTSLGGRHPLYIDGKDRDGQAALRKMNPANDRQLLGEFSAGTRKDAELALRAAHTAWPKWRDTPAAERARLLRRAGTLLEERVYDIAAALTLEVGKNRMEALGEAQEAADFFPVYCEAFEREHGFDRTLPNDPVRGYT